MTTGNEHLIDTPEALAALYGSASGNSLKKVTDHLTPAYREWLAQSPFFALATQSTDAIDCSPRGDLPARLFKIVDDKTLLIPDRRGNNRLDSLRNIVDHGGVALLFLIPGITEALRVMGKAELTTEPLLREAFDIDGQLPTLVIRVHIESVYFQCARAIMRSRLWKPDARLDPEDVPTAGSMIRDAIPGFDSAGYDKDLQQRQPKTLY